MLDAWRLLDVAQTKLSMRRKWEGRLLSIVKIPVTSPLLDLAHSAWNVVFRHPTQRSWLLWLVSSQICWSSSCCFSPHTPHPTPHTPNPCGCSFKRGLHVYSFHRHFAFVQTPCNFGRVYFLSIYLFAKLLLCVFILSSSIAWNLFSLFSLSKLALL